MTSTAVTIDSEHVRRVVSFALWRIVAANIVGERALSDGYYDRAWEQINPAYMLEPDNGPADARLARLAAITEAVRVVESAAAGERVSLPVRRAELGEALQDCVRAIDLNDDLLLGLSAAEREDVIRCRRTALRLMRSLPGTAAPAPPRRGRARAV